MATNKERIISHNIRLETISTQLDTLPTQESVKHGAYVWKKCKTKSPIGIANLSASGTSTVITLESSEGVTEETLDGAVFTATQIGGTYSCTFTLSYANGSKTFSSTDVYGGNYSYSNGVITLNTTFAFTSEQFNASDITFPDVEPEFITFVVSDNSTTYPDGGTQDGYWYEKVVEGIPLPDGFSKFAVDKFVYSSKTTIANNSISHSLGEKPKLAIIISSEYAKGGWSGSDSARVNGLVAAMIGASVNNASINAVKYLYLIGSTYAYDTSSCVFKVDSSASDISYMSENTIKTDNSSSTAYNFTAGVEYTLITMA